MTYSVTTTETFSYTHARHIAAKVATDLKRIQRFYGRPTNKDIVDYQTEITEFLKAGFLDNVTYGFKRNGLWIEPTLRYSAKDLGGTYSNDHDPGRIRPNADVNGASFGSYLVYNSAAWTNATQRVKEDFQKRLPFQRTYGTEPGVNGYLHLDRTYSAGGRAVDRFSLASYS